MDFPKIRHKIYSKFLRVSLYYLICFLLIVGIISLHPMGRKSYERETKENCSRFHSQIMAEPELEDEIPDSQSNILSIMLCLLNSCWRGSQCSLLCIQSHEVWAEPSDLLLRNVYGKSNEKSLQWLGYKELLIHHAGTLSPLPFWLGLTGEVTVTLERPHGTELKVASGQWPAKSWDPQPNNLQGTESFQQPHE